MLSDWFVFSGSCLWTVCLPCNQIWQDIMSGQGPASGQQSNPVSMCTFKFSFPSPLDGSDSVSGNTISLVVRCCFIFYHGIVQILGFHWIQIDLCNFTVSMVVSQFSVLCIVVRPCKIIFQVVLNHLLYWWIVLTNLCFHFQGSEPAILCGDLPFWSIPWWSWVSQMQSWWLQWV